MANFWVNGIVAVRDKQPYIQLSNEDRMIAQLTITQARQVAMDILVMSARTEADAMIRRFFEKEDFPDGAANALMQEFRDYRAELDADVAERSDDPERGT